MYRALPRPVHYLRMQKKNEYKMCDKWQIVTPDSRSIGMNSFRFVCYCCCCCFIVHLTYAFDICIFCSHPSIWYSRCISLFPLLFLSAYVDFQEAYHQILFRMFSAIWFSNIFWWWPEEAIECMRKLENTTQLYCVHIRLVVTFRLFRFLVGLDQDLAGVSWATKILGCAVETK